MTLKLNSVLASPLYCSQVRLQISNFNTQGGFMGFERLESRSQMVKTILISLLSLIGVIGIALSAKAQSQEMTSQIGFEQSYLVSNALRMPLFISGANQELGLLRAFQPRQGEFIDEVVIVLASAAGHGRVSLEVNHRNIFSTQAPQNLTVLQIPVRGQVGFNIQTLKLVTTGNIQIAHLALIMNDQFYQGGNGGEWQPGQPIRPPVRPNPPRFR